MAFASRTQHPSESIVCASLWPKIPVRECQHRTGPRSLFLRFHLVERSSCYRAELTPRSFSGVLLFGARQAMRRMECMKMLKFGNYRRNRTADASLFRVALSSICINLAGPRWLHKPLLSRHRYHNRGQKSWAGGPSPDVATRMIYVREDATVPLCGGQTLAAGLKVTLLTMPDSSPEEVIGLFCSPIRRSIDIQHIPSLGLLKRRHCPERKCSYSCQGSEHATDLKPKQLVFLPQAARPSR